VYDSGIVACLKVSLADSCSLLRSLLICSLCASLLQQVHAESLSEELLEERLHAHVDAKVAELTVLEDADMDGEGSGDKVADAAAAQPLFIGGLESGLEMKKIFGEDFKITYWQ
jgi:hypothetical protein